MSDTLKLPSVFSDHMVLQRDLPLPVWGWAKPQATVTAKIANQSGSAVADTGGRWKLSLKPLPAGGPHELVVTSEGATRTITDVLVGDVWLCGGQSNMEWSLALANNGPTEVPLANHPLIRLFYVPRISNIEPVSDVDAKWAPCNPDTAGRFSAIGYFFGREIQRQIGVPIGLINSNWGGTAVEAWTPRETLQADPNLAHLLDDLKDLTKLQPIVPHVDSGNKGLAMGWADVQFDDANWPTMDIPRNWFSTGMDFDGAVWFRRTVDLPVDFAGKPLELNLGIISDFDVAYFNGVQVGATDVKTDSWWTVPRKYKINPGLAKSGLNTIAVRVFNHWDVGGLLGPIDKMRLFPESQPERGIPLGGDWKYQVEIALPHRVPTSAVKPTLLYNAMIAPIAGFGLRGALWYQGESNAGRAFQYRTIFPLMIQAWRERWGQGDFPFLFVQLANYHAGMDTDAGSPWAELREAQTRALALPNTGQAIAIDIGEAKDIHPRNKLDVGLRLTHEAMRLSYGKPDSPRSPMFESLKINGAMATVSFQFAPGGLTTTGASPAAFTIAGEDRKFHDAVAKIEGSSVTVSSLAVAKPVAVRYGWSQNPPCNLFNRAGLPACPFRTDDWPAVTANAK